MTLIKFATTLRITTPSQHHHLLLPKNVDKKEQHEKFTLNPTMQDYNELKIRNHVKKTENKGKPTTPRAYKNMVKF
jgi:hypothetical protein